MPMPGLPPPSQNNAKSINLILKWWDESWQYSASLINSIVLLICVVSIVLSFIYFNGNIVLTIGSLQIFVDFQWRPLSFWWVNLLHNEMSWMYVVVEPVVGLSCHTFTAAADIEELGAQILPPLNKALLGKGASDLAFPRLSKEI